MQFHGRIVVVGLLIAIALSAVGHVLADTTLQWIVPGVVLIGSVALAMFWPAKRGSGPDARQA